MEKKTRFKCRVKYLHYIAHVSNASSILARGILPHNKVKELKVRVHDISDPNVQTRRECKTVPGTGRYIHDYVPLYFATQTPMQYVITHSAISKGRGLAVHQKDLVFIDVDAEAALRRSGVTFTNGNSASGETEFFTDLADLDRIDWDVINCPGDYEGSSRRCYDSEWKWRRSSEVLIPGRVPKRLFSRLVVFDDLARCKLVRRISRYQERAEVKFAYPVLLTKDQVSERYYFD